MLRNWIGTPAVAAALTAFALEARGAEQWPLACDKPHINVGETQSRQQTHKFELRNVSQKTVQITATHKACGCVKRELSKLSLAPGETSELTLDFPIRTRAGSLGDFAERLAIFVDNENAAPALVVSVSGRLIPVAYVLREGVYIEAPESGKPFQGEIEVFLNKCRGVKIEGIETGGMLPIEATIAGREDTLTEGEEKVVLQVSGTSPPAAQLPASARVVVKLNNKELPEIGIPVSLYRKRRHEVRFSPQMLAFGVLATGAKAKRAVTVELPKLPGYTVEKAEPSGVGVSVAIEEQPKVKHVVLLRCELDASELAGKLEQDLLVTVSVPDGAPEVYKLPISGSVKPGEAKKDRAAEAKQ